MSRMRQISSSRYLRPLGVHVSRIAEVPHVVAAPPMAGEQTVAVRGLVCGVCAMRTASALRSIPGVESAQVDLRTAQATLRLAPGASVNNEELQRSLEGVVIAMPLRRIIARIAATVRRRAAHAGGGAGR